MDILITYDLEQKLLEDSKHTEVKDAMKARGYFDSFYMIDEVTKQATTYYLPNTCLWKQNTTSEMAKNDLIAVARQKNANVERLFATKFESWAAIPGKPYKK